MGTLSLILAAAIVCQTPVFPVEMTTQAIEEAPVFVLVSRDQPAEEVFPIGQTLERQEVFPVSAPSFAWNLDCLCDKCDCTTCRLGNCKVCKDCEQCQLPPKIDIPEWELVMPMRPMLLVERESIEPPAEPTPRPPDKPKVKAVSRSSCASGNCSTSGGPLLRLFRRR